MKAAGQKLKIISYDSQPFTDRIEAGDYLAGALTQVRDLQTVVLGIPRGGLIVAKQVADRLQVPLEIVLSRKIGAPQNQEFAIGSITETGEVFIDETSARLVRADSYYLQEEIDNEFLEIQRRREVYRQLCPKIDLKNKVVIVIDDGIATGSTMQAAFWSVRQEKPDKLIGAFPVGPIDTLQRLSQTADQIICLKVPPVFEGVGRFYLNFAQVSEEEILEILKKAQVRKERSST